MIGLGKLVLERRYIYLKPLVFMPAGIQGHAGCRTLTLPIEELRQPGVFIPSGEKVTFAQRTLRRQHLAVGIDIFRRHMRAAVAVKRDCHRWTERRVRRYARIVALAPFPVMELQCIIACVPFVPTGYGIIVDIYQVFRLHPSGGIQGTVRIAIFRSITQILYLGFLFVRKEILTVLERTITVTITGI